MVAALFNVRRCNAIRLELGCLSVPFGLDVLELEESTFDLRSLNSGFPFLLLILLL